MKLCEQQQILSRVFTNDTSSAEKRIRKQRSTAIRKRTGKTISHRNSHVTVSNQWLDKVRYNILSTDIQFIYWCIKVINRSPVQLIEEMDSIDNDGVLR